jgi:metal-responsive CopG/Arc/MetJ family transcriptional regulator
MDQRTISVTMSESMIRNLTTFAKDVGVSRSSLIEWLLDAAPWSDAPAALKS